MALVKAERTSESASLFSMLHKLSIMKYDVINLKHLWRLFTKWNLHVWCGKSSIVFCTDRYICFWSEYGPKTFLRMRQCETVWRLVLSRWTNWPLPCLQSVRPYRAWSCIFFLLHSGKRMSIDPFENHPLWNLKSNWLHPPNGWRAEAAWLFLCVQLAAYYLGQQYD